MEKWPNAFDDDLTHIPLIIRRSNGARGHRVSELTETFDVMPTICDLEDIPIQHDQFGRSLKAQIQGAAGDPNRVVYCEGGYDVREPHCFEGTKDHYLALLNERTNQYPKMIQQQKDPVSVARGVMMRDNRYKLVMQTNGENELYDMVADRNELQNLYGSVNHMERIHAMEHKMLEWLIHTSDIVPREGHLSHNAY